MTGSIGHISRIVLPILIGIFSLSLSAQDVRFQASATKTTLAVGERMRVEFTINAGADRFQPPSFNGFRILSGPNQSTNMQFINGRSSYTITYSYVLMAMKEGELSIGAASIQVGSDVYKSNELKIRVLKGGTNTQSSEDQNKGGASSPKDNSKGVFITASISNAKPYVGQQATITYKLYFNQNIVDNSFTTLPSLNGFWSQDLDVKNNKRETEVVNGTRYNIAILKRTVVIPQRAGELELDPLAMDLIVQEQVQSRSRNLFDQFFGNYKNVKVAVASKPIKIKVKALPSGRPANFSGAVGSFKMELSADRYDVPSNESINLTYEISGKGNLKLLNEPNINFPSDFEVYDPEVEDNIAVNASGMSGSRKYRYLTIPRHKGNFSIDPVTFTYFDPIKEKYVSLSSDALNFNISQGVDDGGGNAVTFSGANKEDIKLLGSDIRFIKQQTQLLQIGHSFFGTIWYYLLWLSPVPLFFLSLFGFRKYNEKRADAAYMQRSRAHKMATKRLSQAKKLVNESDDKLFYEEIFKALYGFYSDKFNISTSELSKERIRETLIERKVDTQWVDQSETLLSACEMARFAPVMSENKSDIYQKAIELISNIQKQIK